MARPLAATARLIPAPWRARWWTSRGRRLLRRGELRRAVGAFGRALILQPGRFRTLVDLATAHLCARDILEARRALSRARNAHPTRFAQQAERILARWGFDLEAVWRMATPARPTAPAPVPQGAALGPRTVTANHLPYGDCASLDEYARFQAMPPISQAEIESLDWDRILGDFFDA